MFDYRAYRLLWLLAHVPPWKRFQLKQVRRNANKGLMYIIQTHMLHQMFVEDRRWAKVDGNASEIFEAAAPSMEMAG